MPIDLNEHLKRKNQSANNNANNQQDEDNQHSEQHNDRNDKNDEKNNITMLFVHAQDHLMTAMSENNLIKEMIEILKNNYENKK